MRQKPKPLIDLKHVVKIYTIGEVETTILHDISLSINSGEFVSIIGPSGSGKSTLMNIIGMLDIPTKGMYFFENEDISQLPESKLAYIRNKQIGFVFQSFNLLPRLSSLDNVILPAIYKGTPAPVRDQTARKLLEELGLGDRLLNSPKQLSGGQQQRVAIARSLINDPAIILADEPTGNLDSKSGKDVMQILKELNKQGKTIVLITHDEEIAQQAHRTIRVRDGRVD